MRTIFCPLNISDFWALRSFLSLIHFSPLQPQTVIVYVAHCGKSSILLKLCSFFAQSGRFCVISFTKSGTACFVLHRRKHKSKVPSLAL